jgi:hypothetical protein
MLYFPCACIVEGGEEMQPAVISPVDPKNEGRVQIDMHLHVEVLGPEKVRRLANIWLLNNVGNLLGAEDPELVLGERISWRYDVILTSLSTGHKGRLGRIHMDARTGEYLSLEESVEELLSNAEAFLAR